MSYSIKPDAKVAVIGYGSWGTALVKIFLKNEARIGWFITNEEIRCSLRERGINLKYLSDVHFDDMDRLDISDDLAYIISNYDILVFAVPSAFMPSVMEGVEVSMENKFVVSAIKGIVNNNGSLVTVAEYFNQRFNVPFKQIGILTGPCHAEEVALERLSYLSVVCKDAENAALIATKVECDYIRVNLLSDIYGTEYTTVLKNIYAIAVGICSSLSYGDNFIAVLISNAQGEIKRFLDSTYAYEDRDVNTSPYLGDLLVTSYSKFSRNRTFGVMIGKGYSIKSIMMEIGMVAEGYYAAKCIKQITTNLGIEMPIANAVYRVLYEGRSSRGEFAKLSKLLK